MDKHGIFIWESNQSLIAGSIPDSVHTLRFGDNFNQPLTAGTIPDSVHTLTFGHNFDQPLTAGSIPDSVHTLTFGFYFNQPSFGTAGSIPDSIININLHCTYNFFPICKNVNVNVYVDNYNYNNYAENISSMKEIYYGTKNASYPEFKDEPNTDRKIMTLSHRKNMKSAKN